MMGALLISAMMATTVMRVTMRGDGMRLSAMRHGLLTASAVGYINCGVMTVMPLMAVRVGKTLGAGG